VGTLRSDLFREEKEEGGFSGSLGQKGKEIREAIGEELTFEKVLPFLKEVPFFFLFFPSTNKL